MLVAVIRVAGPQFDVETYVQQYGFTPNIVWHAGEADQMGRTHADSGFNLGIGDANSADALVQEIRGWLQDNRSALMALGGWEVRG